MRPKFHDLLVIRKLRRLGRKHIPIRGFRRPEVKNLFLCGGRHSKTRKCGKRHNGSQQSDMRHLRAKRVVLHGFFFRAGAACGQTRIEANKNLASCLTRGPEIIALKETQREASAVRYLCQGAVFHEISQVSRDSRFAAIWWLGGDWVVLRECAFAAPDARQRER